MRASWLSYIGWFTKTIATSEAFASAAAEALSVPGLNSTFAFGACFWMYFIGDEGKYTVSPQFAPPGCGLIALPPGGSTCAEPPPESTPTSACDPIIAIEPGDFSGSKLPEFFSSTMLSSAICCASSRPLKGSTTDLGIGGLSTTPAANMLRRMR